MNMLTLPHRGQKVLLLFAALLLLGLAPTPGLLAASTEPLSDTATIEIARSYFEHLDNQRLIEARKLMADAIAFEDPTFNDSVITDPDEVIKVYSNTAGFSNLLFDERMTFVSNGTVVFHYIVSLSFTPPEDSPVKTPIPVIADLVRMAKVKEGKIIRHMDFAPYSVMRVALKQAEAKLNEQN